jgi:hypothetical protein
MAANIDYTSLLKFLGVGAVGEEHGQMRQFGQFHSYGSAPHILQRRTRKGGKRGRKKRFFISLESCILFSNDLAATENRWTALLVS